MLRKNNFTFVFINVIVRAELNILYIQNNGGIRVLYILLAIAAYSFYLKYDEGQYELDRQSTYAWCDADDALYWWRQSNPAVFIGLSPDGRKLVCECIETYYVYLERHSYIDGKEYLTLLFSLLNQLPPKSPDAFPAGNKQKDAKEASFYLLNNLI